MVILVIGTPLEGFILVGPFNTSDEATRYGELNYDYVEWWTTHIESPDLPQ